MTDRYVELHAASAFLFLEGGSLPETLAQRAFELEMPAMALLDRNGFYGSARFHRIATENGIRAHVGAEVAISSFGQRLNPPVWLPHQHLSEPPRLPLLCETREGYQNLCRLDGRYEVTVTCADDYHGQLAISEDNQVLHRESVGLSYGTIFGPDVVDVADWQRIAVEFVDRRNS